jgi:hypothetical protein
MNTKPLLYDLGVSLGAITLWFTPLDLTRALGYTVSFIFSGRAYYSGVTLLNNERKSDEKQAIAYEAEVDFYDQLLGENIDAALEVVKAEVEGKMLARMIPIVKRNTELEKQLQTLQPIHPEMTDEDRERLARTAIDDAFVEGETKAESPVKVSEEDIRKQFPESMDSTSWKAVLKALQNGASKSEIVRDVLGCNPTNQAIGMAYLTLLKSRFGF